MKHLGNILNFKKHEILVGENSVVRGSPLPLLGEKGLSWASKIALAVMWYLEQNIGLGKGQM